MTGGNACSTILFHSGFQVVSPSFAAFLSIGVRGTCFACGFKDGVGGGECVAHLASTGAMEIIMPTATPRQRRVFAASFIIPDARTR